jgi:hypothetical protein
VVMPQRPDQVSSEKVPLIGHVFLRSKSMRFFTRRRDQDVVKSLEKDPQNLNFLAFCEHQLSEAGEGYCGGSITVHVCDRGARYLYVCNSPILRPHTHQHLLKCDVQRRRYPYFSSIFLAEGRTRLQRVGGFFFNPVKRFPVPATRVHT